MVSLPENQSTIAAKPFLEKASAWLGVLHENFVEHGLSTEISALRLAQEDKVLGFIQW